VHRQCIEVNLVLQRTCDAKVVQSACMATGSLR
jgi:hypothetical protein